MNTNITNIAMYDNTRNIKCIPWDEAPKSESGLRAFARRHGFHPRRTTSGKWYVCWSSTAIAEEFPSAIKAIREEVRYQRRSK